jgi:hypothetical protein
VNKSSAGRRTLLTTSATTEIPNNKSKSLRKKNPYNDQIQNRLIFLSYDLNSSSSKVHVRRNLQEKTEHNKERKWKFKTTVEPDKPNNIRRQRRGVTYHHALCETLEPWNNRPQCAGQSASARKLQSVFGHKLVSELAFLAGNKERKAHMERRGDVDV